MSVRIKWRVWVDWNNSQLMGPGIYDILKAIEETGSIAAAARKLGYSYKFIWTYIKRLEDALGVPLVESKRGGRERGVTELTEVGRHLLQYYEALLKALEEAARPWEERFAQLVESLASYREEAKGEEAPAEEIPYYEEE